MRFDHQVFAVERTLREQEEGVGSGNLRYVLRKALREAYSEGYEAGYVEGAGDTTHAHLERERHAESS